MPVIHTGSHPKASWPGVKAWFGRTYDELPVEWTDFFDVETSDKKYEEEVESIGFGLATVKPEGLPVEYDSDSQGYTSRYTHVTYAIGYMVTREELLDNLYDDVSKRRAPDLAFSMRQTEEIVHANVLNRAFNSSYVGGDGKELVATDHPTFVGNQSNELTTAADISEVAIEDMIGQIMQAKDARGRRIQIKPRSLIVPTQSWFEANRILSSALQNDTANNAVNVLRSTAALPDGIKLSTYLTSDSAWFIRTNQRRGMRHFTREATAFDKDNDFDTQNAKAKTWARWSQGWSDWRGIYGTPGV